jgi:hypothetical protein
VTDSHFSRATVHDRQSSLPALGRHLTIGQAEREVMFPFIIFRPQKIRNEFLPHNRYDYDAEEQLSYYTATTYELASGRWKIANGQKKIKIKAQM